MNPSLGRNFEAMDPLEWLARVSDHIPDPGQHRTLFYGEYSNRVRGSAHQDVPEAQAGPAPEPRRRCSPTWARMIAKVYQTDPLVCARCGQRMSLIAFVTDQMAIGKILDHLGLSTPEAAKPPPPARELLRVAPGRPVPSRDRGALHRRPPPSRTPRFRPSTPSRPAGEPVPRGAATRNRLSFIVSSCC